MLWPHLPYQMVRSVGLGTGFPPPTFVAHSYFPSANQAPGLGAEGDGGGRRVLRGPRDYKV